MNKPEEEIPLLYIERNRVFLLACVAVTALLAWLTWYFLFSQEASEINPRVFFLFVPTLVFFFQTLWFLLNPFAVFFKDKIEIKQSLLHNRLLFYIDVKLVDELKGEKLKVMYNDNEVAEMNLFGIRPSHKKLLREELNKQVLEKLNQRPDDQNPGSLFPNTSLRKNGSL